MAKAIDTKRYYGYARASSLKQETSPDQQRKMIEKFVESQGGTLVHVYQEHESATKVAFDDRPAFKELLAAIKPGDHLVVWRLDRLERKFFRMIKLMDELLEREIMVHAIQETGGVSLDLNTITGRLVLSVFAIAAEFYVEQLRDATMRGRLAKKQRGLATVGTPLIGMKRIKKTLPHGEVVSIDVWDDKQLDVMYEIVHRRDAGESFTSIARDFIARGLRKPFKNKRNPNGVPWATIGKAGRPHVHHLSIAYYRMKKLIADGTLPGTDEARKNPACTGEGVVYDPKATDRPNAPTFGPHNDPHKHRRKHDTEQAE
jgi:DNA invertase Pin-like site-specific DNA recombinase